MADEQMKTPYGAGPEKLDKPVPKEALPDFGDFDFSGLKGGGEVAEQAGNLPEEPMAPAAPAEGVAPPTEPSLMEQATNTLDSFTNPIYEALDKSMMRAKASFATNPTEKINFLERVYGSANVGVDENGELLYRKDSTQAFEPFDPAKFELIDDALDFTREIVEGTLENLGRAGGGALGFGAGVAEGAPAGAAVGSVVPGVGTAAGAATGGMVKGIAQGAVGAAAGGGTAATLANKATNYIQEELVGIPIDPNRDLDKESYMTFGLGAAFNFLAGRMARRKAYVDSQKKVYGENIQSASTKLQDASEAVDEVNASGLIKEGGEIVFTPAQAAGKELPELAVLERELSTVEGYRDFMSKQGELVAEGYDAVIRTLTSAKGIPEKVADRIGAKVTDMRALEGATIGEFRKQALEASGGEKIPLRNVVGQAGEIFESLGIDSNAFINAPAEQRISQLVNTGINKSHAKLIDAHLTKLTQSVEKGITLRELDGQYRTMRTQIDNLMKSSNGRAAAGKLIKIKDALEADRLEAIGEFLPEGSKGAYREAMGNYTSIMSNLQKLNKSLLNGDISREALARKIFTSSNIKDQKALKSLILKSEPELWNAMAADYFQVLKNKHTSREGVNSVVNWRGMFNEYKKIPEASRKELFAGTQLEEKTVEALMKVASFPRIDFAARDAASNLELGKNLFVALSGQVLPTTQAAAIGGLLKDLGGKQNALAQYLNAGGIDDVLKFVPKEKKGFWRTLLTGAKNMALNTVEKGADATLGGTGSAAIRTKYVTGKQKKEEKK